MGLSQKDAVPFLLYSMSLQAVTAQKIHQEHFVKSLRRFFRLLKIFPRKHQQKMFLRY